MELEDMGNNIFNELLRGSFFQDPQKDDFGNVVTCKMHDLMHDLACSITKTEFCAVEAEKIDIVPKSVRHLSYIGSWRQPSSFPYKSLCKSDKCLRTYLVSMDYCSSNPPPLQMIFSKLKYIRVLKLSRIDIRQVPNSIGGMNCLRYLSLRYNYELRFLPDSICSLINLQTLDLRYCANLEALPTDMRQMRSLRHLDVDGCWRLSKMPIKMGEMIGLRTLSKFIVGEKKGEKINELNELKHLSGELELKGLELVKDSTEAKEADLASKPNLSSLTLLWGTCLQEEDEKTKSERVLECLQPHVNLIQKLIIRGYEGVVLPSWMSLLQNLRNIKLLGCRNCESLPPLGQLPLLQVLEIYNMTSLKCIGVEFCGEIRGHLKVFPSLEDLKLEWMPNLEKWEFPSSLLKDASFPFLRTLSLLGCRKLETPSILMPTSCCLRKLKSLTISGGVSFSTQSIHNHTALETLKFNNKDSILSSEIKNLTALKSLEIVSCYKLKSIPDEIGNLKALKSLVIWSCRELISLPAEGLQELTSLNLNSFDISWCVSLKTFPAMGRMIQEGMMMKSSCCSLVYLRISGCGSLTSVSEGLRYLSSLEKLQILNCYELELKREDFQHLTCLRHLTLESLPKFKSVPDVQNLKALQSLVFTNDQNLRMLPEGLQHLTSLQSLQVHGCHPDLHKRLKRNQGIDWPNISHIPRVSISDSA
ncbi:Disease resistance protein rga2 [Thalictrum thalictroides]|uniref:Disease resistance protein rga2 n=1 Tax=Thalictrum thalictroides TaxID=46969 RepID=A0A7J6X606_THATH|nr:Disease resistance protein rga2 [Thalictrum thalictroides]